MCCTVLGLWITHAELSDVMMLFNCRLQPTEGGGVVVIVGVVDVAGPDAAKGRTVACYCTQQ